MSNLSNCFSIFYPANGANKGYNRLNGCLCLLIYFFPIALNLFRIKKTDCESITNYFPRKFILEILKNAEQEADQNTTHVEQKAIRLYQPGLSFHIHYPLKF